MEVFIVYTNDNKKGSSMKKAFTLMELLIAIAIIAILTAIGIVSYTSINKNARNTKRRSDVEQIRSALELYRSDFGYYPSANGGTIGDAAHLSGVIDPYMPAVPTDPKGQPYYYIATNFNATSSQYYGYCIAASMEPSETIDSTCGGTALGGYNYGRRNP